MAQNLQSPKFSKTLLEKIKKIEYKMHIYHLVCDEFKLADYAFYPLNEQVLEITVEIIKDDFIELVEEIDDRPITEKEKKVLYKNLRKEFPVEIRYYLELIQDKCTYKNLNNMDLFFKI